MQQVIFFVVTILAVAYAKFPSYITPCKRDGDVGKCIQANIEACRPYLKEGIPELKVPKMEPLTLPPLEIKSPNLRLLAHNLTVDGISKAEVKDVTVTGTNIVMNLHQPRVAGWTFYEIQGQLLLFRLDSSAQAYGNLTDIDILVNCTGKQKTKNGKVYLSFKDNSKVSVNIKGKSYFYFNDLFKDNEELTVSTNAVINENIVDILNELHPMFEDIITNSIVTIVDQLFSKYTYDEMFPL